MAEIRRASRVAERMREELALLLRGLSDPRLEGVVVTRVEVADDLGHARIFVRREMVTPDPKLQKRVLAGFEAATPRLRRDLTKVLALRVAPVLKFLYDEGVEAQERVAELLREIADEKAKREGG